MFGYSLTHQQERRVLELLGLVSTANREVSEVERQYVVELSHEFNASAEGVFKTSDQDALEEICETFDDETAKRIALVYTVRLGVVDGLYEEDEWLGVRAIGDAFGLPDSDVAELEDWVRRGLEWEEKGRELLDLPSKWEV